MLNCVLNLQFVQFIFLNFAEFITINLHRAIVIASFRLLSPTKYQFDSKFQKHARFLLKMEQHPKIEDEIEFRDNRTN